MLTYYQAYLREAIRIKNGQSWDIVPMGGGGGPTEDPYVPTYV